MKAVKIKHLHKATQSAGVCVCVCVQNTPTDSLQTSKCPDMN